MAIAVSPWIEVYYDYGREWFERSVFAVFSVILLALAVAAGVLSGFWLDAGILWKFGFGAVCAFLFVILLLVGIITCLENIEGIQERLRKRRRQRYIKACPDLRADLKHAIEAGKIVVGMTKEQVHAAIGPPRRIEVKKTHRADLALWEYHWLIIQVDNELRRYDYVYFEGNWVCSVHWSGGFAGHPPPSLPRLPDEPTQCITST
jgi:hypothetical protein